MERCGSQPVDEAVGPAAGGAAAVLIQDCVEMSGAFILHHLIKRSLSPPLTTLIFVSFAHPFSHYDRILRKMGCNLSLHRDNKIFIHLDMLTTECPHGFIELYGKIHGIIENTENQNNITVMIDDLSLMEVAANGSSSHVLDFLQYCHSLITEFNCLLILLHHGDVYGEEKPFLSLQIEYFAEILLKARPLATGLATDVHGQLTVVNKKIFDGRERNFHFRVRENCVEYFY